VTDRIPISISCGRLAASVTCDNNNLAIVVKLPKGRVDYHTKKLVLRGTRPSPQFAQNGSIAHKILKIFPLGGVRGAGSLNVNLAPPIISETTRARKVNLKIPLDMVKYSLWVQKLFYYTIQHEGSSHIDFRQMSISLRQTTANNCKTAFSLHVVESASDDYNF